MAKKRQFNIRAHCRGGDYLLPVKFRGFSQDEVRQVQLMYQSGEYTQQQLSDILGRSISVINRMVRCSRENVKSVKSTQYTYPLRIKTGKVNYA